MRGIRHPLSGRSLVVITYCVQTATPIHRSTILVIRDTGGGIASTSGTGHGASSRRAESIRASVLAIQAAVPGPGLDIERIQARLSAFKDSDGGLRDSMQQEAVEAAALLRRIVSEAVDSRFAGLRALQNSLLTGTSVSALTELAKRREPVAYEALQILCYRNEVACNLIITEGIVDRIAIDMVSCSSVELHSAMCYLLTGLAAFSESSGSAISAAGLIPQLVALCRLDYLAQSADAAAKVRLESRAAAVLRNLAHNTKFHTSLVRAGAVEALVHIMKNSQDPAFRINAALAVACLVGHEESNPRLQLDDDLVEKLLEVLESACQGVMAYGTFWTVWKLCQGLANLSGNEKNKDLITARGGVDLLADVLTGRHHNKEKTHRYALSTVWNLAFSDNSRQVILQTPGLVDSIRSILATTESPKTKEVAKGALWTLGVDQDVKGGEQAVEHVHKEDNEVANKIIGHGGHIMLSYEWGQQQSVLLIKAELQKAGYQTWMDVDEMSGSTLEAMAKAVEGSAVVVLCVSSKYKESQACRTEAEYAFQQRKKIVPVLLEKGYKATGWLGALMGTRLYFDMSDSARIASKAPSLFKEIGSAGKIISAGSSSSSSSASRMEPLGSPEPAVKSQVDNPENWSTDEVEDWLKRIKCSDYSAAFKERDMDGLALCGLLRMTQDVRLVHEVLQSDFSINSLGHRLRLIEELHRLYA